MIRASFKIKKAAKKILDVFWLFPGYKYIILESHPDFADNTEMLYKKMIEHQWNKQFKIIWFISGEKPKEKLGANIDVLPRCISGIELIKHAWIIRRAAAIIDCNIQVEKHISKTLHVHLCHGSPVKSVRDYFNLQIDTDYVMSQSPYWDSIMSYELKIPVERMVTFGYPRNDDLFDDSVEISKLFPERSFDHVVAWYPTYRQHKDNYDTPKVAAIPILHNIQEAEIINDLAIKSNILIVIKPHPAQNINYIKQCDFSNIVFIYDSFFVEHKIRAYQFLAATDALITDYSSVFFDYLLTGKPIGLTFEDFEEYNANPGFAIDISLITDCSYMLDSIENFEQFFHILVSDQDDMRAKRDKVMFLTNQYTDANSSQRVLDFIEEKLRERNLWPKEK